MDKKSLLWQWIVLFLVPSIYLILRDELSDALINCCGSFWGYLFYIGVTIAVVLDIIILIVKTWDYLKPIIENIIDIIKKIISFFRR